MQTISAKARIAGIAGWPIGHSRSPRLHGFWLRRHGIDGAYIPLAIRPEDAESGFRMLPRLGFAGWNVTVPHKEAAFRVVDTHTPTAQRMGAVNTVFVGDDGSLTGDNTDGFGFLENLRHGRPQWSASDGPAVVLGAGGAARAVVVSLLDAGVPEVRLANRTRERAATLAAQAAGAVTVVDWAERAAALDGAALVVNTTTAGMAGHEPLDIALDCLPAAAVVNDIVYTPLTTPLLAAAAARGNPTVTGIDMLLHQGRPGFAGWFGVDPQVDADLRAYVMA